MSEVVVTLKDYSTLRILQGEDSVVRELANIFTFDVPNAKFTPAYKRGIWDGKIRLLNRQTGEIGAGLYWAIADYCNHRNIPLIERDSEYGLPSHTNEIGDMDEWIASLDLPFAPRDYQMEAFLHGIQNKRCVLLSPTGSGKSLMIYMLTRWYLENHDDSVLLIVPTTSLVEQMYSDFKDYGYDVDNLVHRIYSGKDKVTQKRVVVTTWQSIYKLGPAWFESFGCVFGDEVHGFKSKSLTSIMNKAHKAEYRFGTTGTLDGTQVHQLVLESLFGPVKRVTTTAALQAKNELAQLNIDIIQLGYPTKDKEPVAHATYQEEIDFLVSHDRRNNFIRNLALSLDGNTLVLFNLVEKHGKVLRTLIEDKIEENRSLFYVSGEIKTKDREQIRHIVDKQSNAIVLASLGTFSTGINMRNVHNIIFASPSKAQIRILQSIGRGLRVSDDGRETRLYDIADDLRLRKSSKPNFTLTHCGERVRIYKNESFNFKVSTVVL